MLTVDSALDQWRSLLGERVITDTDVYTRNLTEFPDRKIHSILRPVSRAEVRRIVAVEPGVTQRQLADVLAGGPCMLNATGSGAHTSVVGNILERGVGVLGQRTRELRGLEAVLANGEVVRTGHWADDGTPEWHHYPEGVGPDVTGLFAQSGFGIVTAAVVGLHRRRPVELALIGSQDSELAGHVDILRRLRQSRLLRDRIEINTVDDPRLAGFSPGTRNRLTWVALWGEPPTAAVLKDTLSARLSEVTYYAAADALPEPARTRFRKLSGEPGDEYVDAMAGRPG